MEKFIKITSKAIPLAIENVDTDQIIPARFLKATDKKGFGDNVFRDWRFDKNGELNTEFSLNNTSYSGNILIAGDNFGCGSSREHAVWALDDYGFSVIISSSFADIFFSNCFKNGLLPITLDSKIVDKLLHETNSIEVDLDNQLIKTSSEEIPFEINSHKKKILLEGLDDIAQTFQFEDKISEFEEKSTVPSVL